MNRDGQLFMTDVPSHVWDSVYEKWRNAYLDGWNRSELWSGCSLCKFVNSRKRVCNDCPLYEDGWCRTYLNSSKISIEYHEFAGYRDENIWRSRIQDFLVFLKPYCTEDIDG